MTIRFTPHLAPIAAASAHGRPCGWAIALVIASAALTGCKASQEAPPADDPALRIVVPGRQLTDADATTLEAELFTTPGDMAGRVDLLWFYRGQFGDPAAERAGNRHVLWLIAHQPRAAVLATPVADIAALPDRAAFDEAKALWLRQVEENPKDAKLLGNAGIFFAKEDLPKAVTLLEQAHRGDPKNATWPQALAEVYRLQAMAQTGEQRQVLARLSLSMYERAAELTRSVRHRMFLLARAATIARHTGDDGQKAADVAQRTLELAQTIEPGPDRAAAEHNAHVVTGLHRLLTGKQSAARDGFLRLAAEAVKDQSPALADLDMSLAKELIDRGEKSAVIAYLQAIAQATQSGEVPKWIETIKGGGKQDLSGFLH